MKGLVCLICFTGYLTLSCQGQVSSKQSKEKFEFNQLTFHLSECNGSCPAISMNVYSNKTIELSRTIYKSKDKVDTAASGNFKGQLSGKSYNKIIGLLAEVNWDTIVFPKVLCCDKSLKTIILTYNGETRRFKSMEAPQSVMPLINYLINVGINEKFSVYNKPIDFEEILD
jgi:hypothetical protein